VAEPSSAPAASARRVVSAAPAADSGLSLAAVLGITQQPGKTVSESVAAALEGRVQLLVFDNCEHVLGAAADLVEAILAQSATVRMIATSREGLGVLDEQLWPVSSLDVARGIDSSAAALFLERARSVVPDLSIAQADEVSVVEICCRLDGIPLAIELAASRMSSMTAIEVRDRLDHRFRLLVGSRRGLERHQTLRQALAWSYDLISDAEKALLARCSVFAGGFDLQSACVVAGSDDLDEYTILDLLDALVRKSLLIADPSTGRTRFSMLETIRQFAEEQLVARGEAQTIRRAHARYFVARKADIMALWDSPPQRDAYAWFTSSWPTCALRFGGPPTRVISASPPLLRPTRRCSALRAKTTSPSHGPKNSSDPRGPSTILGSRPYMQWRRCATSLDGSRKQLSTLTPAGS
jgi:predicted ATPase